MLQEMKVTAQIDIIWERFEERFTGDPATILTFISSLSGLLWLLNRIVGGWRCDVIVDTRKKGIIVTETLPSRHGHVIIIKSNGETETLSGPTTADKLNRILSKNL